MDQRTYIRYRLKFRADVFEPMTETLGLHKDEERATALGFTASYYSRVKSGQRRPSHDFIAAVLGMCPHADFRSLFELVRYEVHEKVRSSAA